VQDPVSGAWTDLVGNVLNFQPRADGLTPTSLKVRLATVNDTQREAAGSVSLTATVVSGVTANATAGAVNTVLDNDLEGTVRESGLAGINEPPGSTVGGPRGLDGAAVFQQREKIGEHLAWLVCHGRHTPRRDSACIC